MRTRLAPAAPAGATLASANVTAILSALLEARTGQQLASYRSWRLDTALTPLLRSRGLASLEALVALLMEGQDMAIGDEIVDAILNRETSFFRDAAVFDLLRDAAAERQLAGRRLRVWCAGCATGQEPLSLAMMFADADLPARQLPEIVATDISEAALARARSGRYTQFEIQRGLPIRRVVDWFEGDGNEWRAKAELVRRIQYRRLNLVTDPVPPGQFDVILCRNVLLYLSPPLKARIFVKLARAIRPGGLLMLGAGETVIGQTDLFVPSQTWRGLYERSTVPAPDEVI